MKEEKKSKQVKVKTFKLVSRNRNFPMQSSHDVLTDTNGPGFHVVRLKGNDAGKRRN